MQCSCSCYCHHKSASSSKPIGKTNLTLTYTSKDKPEPKQSHVLSVSCIVHYEGGTKKHQQSSILILFERTATDKDFIYFHWTNSVRQAWQQAAAIPTHSHNYLELRNGCGGQVRPSRQLYIFPSVIIDLGEILVNHIVID